MPLEADVLELPPPFFTKVGLLPLLPLLVVNPLSLDPLAKAGVGTVRLGDVGVAVFVPVVDELLEADVPVHQHGTRCPLEPDGVEGSDALLGDLRLFACLELLVLGALLGHPLAERNNGRVGALLALALPRHVARVVNGLVGLELLEAGVPCCLVAGESGRRLAHVRRSLGLGGILPGKLDDVITHVDLGGDGGIVGGRRPLEADALEDADAIAGKAQNVLPGLLARVQIADVPDPGVY